MKNTNGSSCFRWLQWHHPILICHLFNWIQFRVGDEGTKRSWIVLDNFRSPPRSTFLPFLASSVLGTHMGSTSGILCPLVPIVFIQWRVEVWKLLAGVDSEFRVLFPWLFPSCITKDGLLTSRRAKSSVAICNFSEFPKAVDSLRLLQHSLSDDFKFCWDTDWRACLAAVSKGLEIMNANHSVRWLALGRHSKW